jgi:hypothetical protein
MNTPSPTNKPITKRLKQFGLLACLLITMLSLAGCEAFAFFTQVISPEKTPAVFDLPVRRTVILVDDTSNQLGDPTHTGVIAQRMLFDFVQSKKLTQEQTVSYRFVRDLEGKLGTEFERTPVDQIGRELGADQVIHVNIDYVQMSVQPGIIEPKAIVTLKVIDVNKAIRLFPEPSPVTDIDGLETSKRGYRITVELPRVVMMEIDSGTQNLLFRTLSEQIGYTASRVFYKHPAEEDAQGPGKSSTEG